MESHTFSFLSVVFGHNRGQKTLEQRDSILISITNDHGGSDRWELVCSTNIKNEIANDLETDNSEQEASECTPLNQSFPSDYTTINTMDDTSHNIGNICTQKGLLTWIKSIKIFNESKEEKNQTNRKKEYEIEPWYKELSKDHYFKVSEPKNTLLGIFLEMKKVSEKGIEIGNIGKDFSVHTYSIHNPPKSSRNHSVFALGVNLKESKKISQLSECLYMRIYASRNLPFDLKYCPPRPLILSNLIKKCKSWYIEDIDIVHIYDYFSTELDNACTFTSKKRDEKEATIQRIHNLKEEECRKLAETIENKHHGPLTLLLFFSSYVVSNNEEYDGNKRENNLKALSTHILKQMKSQRGVEKSLIDEFELIYNPIKNKMHEKIERETLSVESVRMLMKELSIFCTKYSHREASHASIAFSMYLKAWTERSR